MYVMYIYICMYVMYIYLYNYMHTYTYITYSLQLVGPSSDQFTVRPAPPR